MSESSGCGPKRGTYAGYSWQQKHGTQSFRLAQSRARAENG